MSETVIGIDLGTTNSVAAVYYDGVLRTLENREGQRTTPSVVFFPENRLPIVGSYAKKMSLIKPDFGVFEIKRLIGRQKNDPYVEDNLKYLPFKLDPDSEQPEIVIEHNKSITKKTPSSIAALILKEIKEGVENKLGHEINKAVITVPAYFNVSQREETLKAAEKAGFEVLKLLNEPTAAALSYYHYKKLNKMSYAREHYSLVFDLGGGTFDVAIIKKSSENIEVVCVDGDSHLGGHDFDQKIFDFVCKKIQTLYNIKTDSDDRRKTRRLLNMCEEAKKELTTPKITKTQIFLNRFYPELDGVEISVGTEDLERTIEPYIQKAIQIVDNCMKTAKLSKDDISEIILAGGSTRIPKIQETLSQYFPDKSLIKFLNSDECVAEGAAIQAALLSKNSHQQIDYIQISEVIPLSLGISELCNRMSVIIPRNSKIPITNKITCVNSLDQQRKIVFNIYEGERLNVKKNRYLATLTIDNLTPAPPEQCEVVLEMSIDNNGILTVTAQETYKNNVKDLKATCVTSANNERCLKSEIQSNEEYEEEDRKFEEFTTKKLCLIDYCVNFCYQIKVKGLIDKYRELFETCVNVRKELVRLGVEGEKRLEELTKNISRRCNLIAISYNFEPMPSLPGPNEMPENSVVHNNSRLRPQHYNPLTSFGEFQVKVKKRLEQLS